jgi:hypothetical protein
MIPIRLKAGKATKYRNERVEFDGLKFDSKREAARWGELRMLEKLGRISMLRRQVAYELAPPVKFAGARARKPAIRFIADFEYLENGVRIVEDVKSTVTAKLPAFQMKRHLMLAIHGIDLRIVT